MIDRLLNWVERLSGPPEAWFATAGVMLSLIGHAVLWAAGTAFPQIEPELIVAPVMAGLFLALSAFMRRTADAAFDDFRPALANPEAEETERHRLVSVPDRAFLISAIAITVMTTALYLAFVGPGATPRTPTVDGVITAGWIVFSIAIGLIVAQTVTQLRAVRHLSQVARNIDVLNPGPVAALSRVTAVGGVGLLIFIAAASVGLPASASGYVALDIAVIVFALVAFLLPLQVMHKRLARQRADLLAACVERLKSVLAALHQAVDARDYSSADQLNKMLTSAIAERDLLTRLQTWPWTATTIRGFASALLLPVVIFVITRGIDRLI